MPIRSYSVVRPVVAAAAAALVALGCSDSTGPKGPVVSRVEIAPPPDVVALDDTVRLRARALDRSGNDVPDAAVHWSLSTTPANAASIATVDSAGLVTARGKGVAIVVATVGSVRDSVAVTVADAPAAVHVVAGATMLASGATLSYRAVVLGRRGDTLTTAPVTWSTTDASAVTTTASGVVSAAAKGSAWITAASGAARDSVQVMVDYRKLTGPQPFVTVSLYTQPLFPGQGCALTAAGAAYCWGNNGYFGMLGNGSTIDSPTTPVAVAGNLTFKELHAGRSAACGLTAADGALYCWGRNDNAEFGTGSRLPASSSVPMLTGSGLRFRTMSLSIDASACGVSAADAVVYCWGTDTYLTTGKDTAVAVYIDSIVAPVTGALEATQVHVFDYHGCAIGADRATWCWGWGETFGLTGVHKAPTQVAPPDAFATVVTGFYSTCALKADGQAYCWGYPPVAPGTDPSVAVMTPTPVGGSLRFKKISVGYSDFACGLTTGGDVYCWGSSAEYAAGGVIGRPGSAPASAPVPVLPGRKFVDIDQSCAVDVAGDVYCWF